MKRLGTACWLTLTLTLALAACGEDLTVTPVRNLERPSDMDFVCLAVMPPPGGQGASVVTGLPMSECYVTNASMPVDGGAGSALAVGSRISLGLFTNTARSELGAINLLPPDQGGDRLLDLDHRQPGYNMIPVGTLPEHLAASDDGCTTVTANRGSCDLSVIDNTRMLAAQIEATPSTGPGDIVRRLRIRTGDGQPFWALPSEVFIVKTAMQTQMPPTTPPPLPPDAGAGDAPAADAAVADAAPEAAPAVDAGSAAEAATGARQVAAMCAAETPHQAVVSFPGCDLVALIDLNTGNILSSVHMRADGTMVDAGTSPVCSPECTGGGRPADAATAADGGAGAGTGHIGVTALAQHPEADVVYVGATRSPAIATLGVSAKALQPRPDLPPLVLAENPGGVTKLRLSRDPYRKLEDTHFVGPNGRFLYAFAQDGSIRVVSLDVPNAPPSQIALHECDVNVDVDPRMQTADKQAACRPIGSVRNVLARGPGLRPPVVPPYGDPVVGPALPVDIAFTHVARAGTGFLLTSNGVVYQVGLGYHPTPNVPGEPPTDTLHGVRPFSRIEVAKSYSLPTRNFSDSTVAFPTRVAFNTGDTGPFLQPNEPVGGTGDTTFLFFPRPERVPRGRVVLRWEGILPFSRRDTGKLTSTGDAPGSAGALTDEAANFCGFGVEVGDVVGMAGCDDDRECESLRNEVCYRAAPGAQGACLPRTLISDEGWARRCQAELGSRRRYEVTAVTRTRVDLELKPDEVPRPSVAPCDPAKENDSVCQPDSVHRPDLNLPGDRGFQCVELKQGKPRCLKPCGVRPAGGGALEPNDELCRAGYVCANMGNPTVGPVCVEGPAPRAECTPADAHYQIQAGKTYLVSSSGLPFFSRMREGDKGACVEDEARPPQLISRIPLNAPACTTVTPGLSAEAVLDGTVFNALTEGRAGDPCVFRPADRPTTVSTAFENAHFRLVLNNLDTYVGDAAVITASIDEGYRPVTVTPSRAAEAPNLGVRILTGPMKARTRDTEYDPPPPYLFIVDQSRTTSLLSRGKIMRINPYPYLYPPGGHFDSLLTGSLFPIQ